MKPVSRLASYLGHALRRQNWHRRWRGWKYRRPLRTTLLVLGIGTASFLAIRPVFAVSDVFDIWNFSTPSDYTLDSGAEIVGNSVRLKTQDYTSDANTQALYHLDESSGANVDDASPNNNSGTVNGTASWTAGKLNNALSLNGTTNVTVPDASSLSLSQNNTLEAWTKFPSTFGAGTHDRKQGVIDKGAYRLYYDQETGKVTYELASSSASGWTQQAGNDTKNSWDLNGKLAVSTQVAIGNDVYAGLGNVVGDAEVWKWNGSTWSQVGGDGKNSSWADQTFENVTSMVADGTTLYAGLGTGTSDAEVWSCNTATGCTSWIKVGGDGLNSGWAANVFEQVDSMTVMGGNLYAGLGTGANDARVYRWNGSTWTWVGGFGVGAPYNAFTTGYEQVYSMTNDGANLFVGLGNTAGDGDVWRLTGTTWTQIGGDGLNSGWAAALYEYSLSLEELGGAIYAGLGTTAGEAEVWRFSAGAWTKIGGDTVNTSWDSSSYEGVYSMTNDGTNIYAGLGSTAGDNEVWRYNGTSWTKIGGDTVNSSFTNTHLYVDSLVYTDNTLYAGITGTAASGEVWSYNGSTWARTGGNHINHSWGFFNIQNVESMTVYGDYLYVGTGNTVAGNATVWRFDGSEWDIVGGQGLNSSWPAGTYENVMSMASMGGNLYAGLGTGSGDGEVWRYNGSTWTQVGGDSLNGGWAAGFDEVYALASFGGNLYAGLGNTATEAEVWRYNGTTWTKIGGDGLNSSWSTTYERVSAFAIYDGQLYAGLGNTVGDAEVYRWSGSAWSKVGGDGLASSWNTNYEQVESMVAYNGRLYAGLGNSTGDAEVWEYNGTTWTQIGGDGISNSWLDGQYEQAKSLTVYNGRLYAGLGNTAGDAEVWELSSGTWSRVGGSGTGWTANTYETLRSFAVYKGKLYAGLGDTANSDAAIWSFGNNGFLQSAATSQDTNWHHIAATYDGATMKLYIDGTLNASAAVSLSMPDTADTLLIGSIFGNSEAGSGQGYFNGSLDEIRISNTPRTSFTTKPYSNARQTVTLTDAVRQTGIWHWDNYTTNESANGGTITYRLSYDDGATWKYWNGSAWATSANTTQANSAAVIDANINTFPVTLGGITWQAVLLGNGDEQVTLNSITLASTSDTVAPSTASTTISALKAAGGSTLSSNAWTNGSSPYFSWTAATDADSGVKGYCAYLGTDSTADPVGTKGLLGTSPETPGSACQFILSATQLDLATPGYLATALSTSNSSFYLRLKAIDNAGNVSSNTAQFSFRFDNTVPVNPGFISAPSGFVSSKAVTLTWPQSGGDSPSDANAGLAGLQYRIGSSGTWYGDAHSGSGDNSDLLTNDGVYVTQDPPDFDALQEGTNTIYFRTWDAAGNVTAAYVTAAVKINTVGSPSEPQNLDAAPDSNVTNSFAFSWDEPVTFVGDADNLSYCYTVNVVPSATNCTFTAGGVTSLGAGPYATQPGTNTMYVVAKDESDRINYESYASVTFTANTPSPGIPLNVDIVDVSIKSTSNWRLALTWDVPSNVGAGIASYKIFRSTNNVDFTAVGSSSSTTYIDANLSQQRYYYRVQACDSTNNCGANSSTVSDTPTGKFTTPAELVAQPTVSDITTKRATIRWSTDRASDSKIAIGTASGSYSPSEVGSSLQVSSHSLNLENLSAGTTYYFVAKWTDGDGNTGSSQEFSFTTAPAPIFKEITSQKSGLTSTSVVFTVRNAVKVSLFYGPSESFGGVKTINTSTAESSYTVDLNDLNDGTRYFYKLVAYDSENGAYESSIFTFDTPQRPKITDLRFQPVEGEPTSTQKVTWLTNVPATSNVSYGKVGTPSSEIAASQLVTSHEIIIRDMADDSEYSLIASSRDADGNLATSDRHVFRTALDTRPPKISEISVESSIRGSGLEARGQVVVSWRTDELATSQVAYAAGSSTTVFNNRSAEDKALSFEHIVIVSDLPTSKVYSIQPVSSDRSGNAGTGDPQSAIVGRASDNVLTIVIESLKRIFGF